MLWVARRRGINPAEPPWTERGKRAGTSGHGVQKPYKNTAPILAEAVSCVRLTVHYLCLPLSREDNEILEIKNIAVDPKNQGKGYGKALIDFLASKYADEYSILQVGTGDSPLTVPFYEKYGFVRSHNIPNFFTDNYDHPIYECGVQLIDMVYLQRHI